MLARTAARPFPRLPEDIAPAAAEQRRQLRSAERCFEGAPPSPRCLKASTFRIQCPLRDRGRTIVETRRLSPSGAIRLKRRESESPRMPTSSIGAGCVSSRTNRPHVGQMFRAAREQERGTRIYRARRLAEACRTGSQPWTPTRREQARLQRKLPGRRLSVQRRLRPREQPTSSCTLTASRRLRSLERCKGTEAVLPPQRFADAGRELNSLPLRHALPRRRRNRSEPGQARSRRTFTFSAAIRLRQGSREPAPSSLPRKPPMTGPTLRGAGRDRSRRKGPPGSGITVREAPQVRFPPRPTQLRGTSLVRKRLRVPRRQNFMLAGLGGRVMDNIAHRAHQR